jgi:hypothetical protein
VLTELDYTVDSWTAYTDVITAGISVEGDVDATQEDIDEATASINDTKENLVFAGQADLDTAKDNAEVLKNTDYTEASWENLISTLALPESTNAEVVDKATAITNAIAALVSL